MRRDEFDDPEGFFEARFHMFDRQRSFESQLFDPDDAGGRRWVPLAALAGAGFLLGAVIWMSYGGSTVPVTSGEVPLIEADAGPIREAPEDPGGMDIPHRDSTVFETLKSQRPPGAENILTTEEKPLPKSKFIPAPKLEQPKIAAETPAEAAPAAAADIKPVADAVPPDGEGVSTPEVADTAAPQPDEGKLPSGQDIVKSVAGSAAKTEPAAGPVVKEIAKGGDSFLQLGSVRDEAAAKAEWKRLKAKYPTQLGGLELRIRNVDLPGKGVYYRIQAGPVSRDAGKSLCSEISKTPGGACMVVGK